MFIICPWFLVQDSQDNVSWSLVTSLWWHCGKTTFVTATCLIVLYLFDRTRVVNMDPADHHVRHVLFESSGWWSIWEALMYRLTGSKLSHLEHSVLTTIKVSKWNSSFLIKLLTETNYISTIYTIFSIFLDYEFLCDYYLASLLGDMITITANNMFVDSWCHEIFGCQH